MQTQQKYVSDFDPDFYVFIQIYFRSYRLKLSAGILLLGCRFFFLFSLSLLLRSIMKLELDWMNVFNFVINYYYYWYFSLYLNIQIIKNFNTFALFARKKKNNQKFSSVWQNIIQKPVQMLTPFFLCCKI